MFIFELDIFEEVSGKSKKLIVSLSEFNKQKTILLWVSNEFNLTKDDDYWFTVDSITAKYVSNNQTEVITHIESEYERFSLDESEEIMGKIKNKTAINV